MNIKTNARFGLFDIFRFLERLTHLYTRLVVCRWCVVVPHAAGEVESPDDGEEHLGAAEALHHDCSSTSRSDVVSTTAIVILPHGHWSEVPIPSHECKGMPPDRNQSTDEFLPCSSQSPSSFILLRFGNFCVSGRTCRQLSRNSRGRSENSACTVRFFSRPWRRVLRRNIRTQFPAILGWKCDADMAAVGYDLRWL